MHTSHSVKLHVSNIIFDLAGKPRWPHLPRLPDSIAPSDLCVLGASVQNTADKQHQLPHEARSIPRLSCCLSVLSLLLGGGGRYCSISERVCLALCLVGTYWLSQDHSKSHTTGYNRRYTWDSRTNGGIKDETFYWPLKYVILQHLRLPPKSTGTHLFGSVHVLSTKRF